MKKFKIIIILLLAAVFVFTLTESVYNYYKDDEKETKNEKETKEKTEEKEEVKDVIIITLDVDGGLPVEFIIVIEKGNTTTLPEPEKDGYTFEGWYLNDQKIESDYIYNENTLLKAKWKEKENELEEIKIFTVSFDSKGGSKENSIAVECGKTLPDLPTPKKDSYKFISWADKNGKVILKGALLSCNNITLYANWEYNGSATNQGQNNGTNSGQNNSKIYTCPQWRYGKKYELNGTKCILTLEIGKYCPKGTILDIHTDLCLSTSDFNKGTKACGKKTVNSRNGYIDVQGVKVDEGTMFCYYGEVNDSNENNQENCTNSGHKWSNSLNKCFLDMDQNYITECPADYEYYDSSNYWELFEVQNNGSGCYKKIAKENGCPSDDFVLTANSCVHTMDAKVIN